MALFKSSNPAMQEKAFDGTIFQGMTTTEAMTVKGTLNKFGFIFLMMMGSCFFAWNQFYKGGNPMTLMMIGVFGGLIFAFAIIFKKQWAPYLAPGYALLEGLFVGSVSAYYDYAFKTSYPGLIMQAVGLTLVVALVMYLIYKFRIIRVTQKFRAVIIIATISLAAFYFIQWMAYLFGANIGAFTNAATPLGIGFSVVVVCLAALNLLLDFDMVEKGVESQAPKFMEWYCAFGLLVTLVWLYLEILRLLSKLNRR
ncbi:MAG TPA: Bax inhibitor-1/YccA family protein [Chitinophagaceae bacterium]|nr:Bax inhibitor-1/YccA family protein [Chitinophagaceae bacterium]